MAKTETASKNEFEREYIIPLRRNWMKVPVYKRANKAVKTIKEFLVRHMKVRDRDLNKIKIDKFTNEMIWSRGIKRPPFKIKVRARKEGDIIRVEAVELPEILKFKKGRLEKREKKAEEVAEKKKPETKPEEKPEEQQTEEQKTEEKEKKAAVVESGQEMEKAAAKKMKHQTKMSKQPKRQRRMALEK